MKIKEFYGLVLMCIVLCLTGCSVEKADKNKIRDLKFQVIEDSQIPEELQILIEEEKSQEFKMTFDTVEGKYIAVGYGVQETGGYSIAIKELYETENAIYINTNLIGPAKGEQVAEAKSFPYIIVKVEYLDKSVVFE